MDEELITKLRAVLEDKLSNIIEEAYSRNRAYYVAQSQLPLCTHSWEDWVLNKGEDWVLNKDECTASSHRYQHDTNYALGLIAFLDRAWKLYIAEHGA